MIVIKQPASSQETTLITQTVPLSLKGMKWFVPNVLVYHLLMLVAGLHGCPCGTATSTDVAAASFVV